MTLRAAVRLARPATLPAVAAGVLGGAVAAAGGWPADALAPIWALLSGVLLTGASNALNQIADLETDRINRPDRPLPRGDATTRAAWAFTAVLTAAALAFGAAVNVPYLACIVLTIPVTAAYSLPPLRTKRIPLLANATIATPRGLLLVVAGWAAGGGFERAEAWLLGALAWLYIFGASTTKDFADTAGDEATGCRTLPLVLGPRRAALFVAPFLVAPFLLYPAFAATGLLPGGIGRWALLGGALAAVGGAAAAMLVRRPAPPGNGSPHPAWGLMYLQLASAHLGTALLFATL